MSGFNWFLWWVIVIGYDAAKCENINAGAYDKDIKDAGINFITY